VDERPPIRRLGFHLERLLNQWHRVLQAVFVVPVDSAKNFATAYPVASFLFKIQPHCRVDDVVHAIPSGTKRI
jgi:hypothetical protein